MIAATGCNTSKIERTLQILHGDSPCFEIRALKVPARRGRAFTAAGYFTSIATAARAAGMYSDQGAMGVYVTLNPVMPALLARSPEKMTDYLEQTTSDAEITCRQWLIIDIDPTRPAGVSASNEEQLAARSLASQCEDFLSSRQWPLPIIGSSGNGYALLYRIDLPNNPPSKELLSDVLKALHHRMLAEFGNAAHVDLSMFNAARIVRLFGTMNRKGNDMADRPHRLAELFDPPEVLEAVSVERLREIAAEAPAATAARQQASGTAPLRGSSITQIDNDSGNIRPRLDMARWLSERGRPFELKTNADGRARFQIKSCVFDPSHIGTSACFMQDDNGRPSYKCFHSSCAGLGWQQAKLAVGVPDSDHYTPPIGQALACSNTGIVTGASNHGVLPGERLYRPTLITSEEFDNGNYTQRFLVKQLLVAGQHGIIGGRYKTLKTSIAVDLGLSLGTGTPFLGEFETVHARTMILSGESGAFTLRETARRIADARGIRLSSADVLWGFELPQIARTTHLDALAEIIEQRSAEVLIIDPAYLCLLGGNTQGKQASNLFDMGPILLGLSEVAQWTDTTIILLHHCRKNTADQFAPPELDELSMSGFAEWARQWLLIGRRQAYEQDSGLHRLWLNIGGSAGQTGCFAADINEGRLDDDFGGRTWNVEVKRPEDANREATETRELQRTLERTRKQDRFKQRLLESLRKFPEGETARELRELSGLNGNNFSSAIGSLIGEGRAEACSVAKGTRHYGGYRPTAI